MVFSSARLTRPAMRLGCTAIALSFITTAAPAEQGSEQLLEAQLVEDVGASERVDSSGKLRMLSQRIAAAACNLAADNDPDAAKQILHATVAEFELIATALEIGNTDLNIIGAEERRKTLFAIEELRTEWAPIKQAAEGIAANGLSKAEIEVIFAGNMPLLERAKLLVSEISGQYSDPAAMLQSDAMLVDISGRQRMLSQKISKEACYLWSDGAAQASTDTLQGTMSLFETSLNALISGFPDAGINPPPTPEIVAGLDLVNDDWIEVKAYLDRLIAGETLTSEEQADTFQMLNTMLKDMNAVVQLYTKFAKRTA